jgi:hypothetical protein
MTFHAPETALLDILSYRRRADSKAENAVIQQYIAPLGAMPDSFGNYVLRIGNAPILYSSHTDSVHKDGGRQNVQMLAGVISLSRKSSSNCLGADDGVGIWLMREMIKAKVPGLYIFHRKEESSGVGSSFIAEATPKLLHGIKAAIAFDRRGTKDVITYQAGGRCASDLFANSLATILGNGYKASDAGIFTDTANYTGLIGECTNLSVGYKDEHTKQECLSMHHAMTLRASMIAFDSARLKFSRQPGEPDPDGYSFNLPDYDDDKLPGRYRAYDDDASAMTSLIRDNPTGIADLLLDHGFDMDSLTDEIYHRGGMVKRYRA